MRQGSREMKGSSVGQVGGKLSPHISMGFNDEPRFPTVYILSIA
jgi:hypothetical protein